MNAVSRFRVRHRARGFTVLELMMALTVTAILAMLVVPSMRDYLRNSRLSSAGNDLLHSLAVARAEAIKRQTNAVVCSTASPSNVAPICDGTAFQGWFVFADVNNNGVFDAGDVIVERHGPIDPSIIVAQDGNGMQIFLPSGFARPAAGGFVPTRNIVFSDARGNVAAVSGNSTARAVLISVTGRARVTRSLAEITTVLASPNVSAQ
jgi:type IV fimbrial biogenesis protein FimT